MSGQVAVNGPNGSHAAVPGPVRSPGQEPSATSLEQLYRRHHRVLTLIAIMSGFDAQEAQDAVQDVFLGLLRQQRGDPRFLERLRHPKAYLVGAVRHKVSDHLRRGRSRTEIPLPGTDMPEQTHPEDALRSALETEQTRQISAMLEALPPRQEQVLSLILDGYTPTQAAKALGLSPNNVRVNLTYARKSARRFLNKNHSDTEPSATT
ncbi:sigma-70 family RNA polymerase sigma factor [Nonomuraea sp. NPDC049709]|uniref:RNA polymerase sigma factor n=1 Tax=Nonomuraea sp. NPDC049709 TaxID=3154736 RepID=UPI0034318FCA